MGARTPFPDPAVSGQAGLVGHIASEDRETEEGPEPDCESASEAEDGRDFQFEPALRVDEQATFAMVEGAGQCQPAPAAEPSPPQPRNMRAGVRLTKLPPPS